MMEPNIVWEGRKEGLFYKFSLLLLVFSSSLFLLDIARHPVVIVKSSHFN